MVAVVMVAADPTEAGLPPSVTYMRTIINRSRATTISNIHEDHHQQKKGYHHQ